MKNFKDFLNNSISDELLAAYIDGNTTESENALIEHALNGDAMFAEANEIARDCVSFGSNFDWELHKGDFGFWELGLPPIITESDIDRQSNIEIPENISLSPTDDTIANIGREADGINGNDITTNDLNANDF